MTEPSEAKLTLDEALAKDLSCLRDVSTRDGIQSWDGNRWQIGDVVPLIEHLDTFAQEIEKIGGKFPPIEAWGGAQYAVPARVNKENPFDNLRWIRQAGSHLHIQALFRGRQGLGYKPLSPEVLGKLITHSAENGVDVIRVFDMMNDIRNIRPSFEAIKEYNQSHSDHRITIEGAVSYINEPEGKPRAWTLEDYADYAVELAKAGSDEIAIKNYAGVGGKEMPELIRTIRRKLDEAGFTKMPVNLHMHGSNADLVLEAFEAGAGKVDVAIGDLSDGPSHPNMRRVLGKMLAKQGFDINSPEVQNHPVLQQLTRIEERIHDTVMDPNGAVFGQSFDDRRGPLKKLTQEDIERYRMAGGAFSDLLGRIRDIYPALEKEFETRRELRLKELSEQGVEPLPDKKTLFPLPDQNILFRMILEEGIPIWEKAGRFNTVTPGAKFLIDVAQEFVLADLRGEPITMQLYQKGRDPETGLSCKDFVGIVTGRRGTNRGMDNGAGDIKFRDALLMYNALEKLNKAVAEGALKPETLETLTWKFSLSLNKKASGQIDLSDPGLEKKLSLADIQKFRDGAQSLLPKPMDEQILAELTSGRAPDPADDLQKARAIVEDIEGYGIKFNSLLKGEAEILAATLEPAITYKLFKKTDRQQSVADLLERDAVPQPHVTGAIVDFLAGRSMPRRFHPRISTPSGDKNGRESP